MDVVVVVKSNKAQRSGADDAARVDVHQEVVRAVSLARAKNAVEHHVSRDRFAGRRDQGQQGPRRQGAVQHLAQVGDLSVISSTIIIPINELY